MTPVMNATQPPFPQIVVVVAFVLVVVGLAMVAGYIEKSSVQGMAFTVLVVALTTQNYFVYRDLWDRVSVNDP